MWYFQDRWRTNGYGLLQETPGWAAWIEKVGDRSKVKELTMPTTPADIKPGVLLRYENVDSDRTPGALLLRHTIGDGVYRFDPAAYTVESSTDEEWTAATGQIVRCESQRWTRPDAFNVDNMNYRLTRGSEPVTYVETYGKYALDAIVPPSKSKAAILSAHGPKRPIFSFGPFGGGDVKIYGRRYLQIMDLASEEYLDLPVILHSSNALPYFSACWSQDERIVIAYSYNFSDFQIVWPFQQTQ